MTALDVVWWVLAALAVCVGVLVIMLTVAFIVFGVRSLVRPRERRVRVFKGGAR